MTIHEDIDTRKLMKKKLLTRRNFLYAGAGTLVAGLGAAGYGFGIEPDLVRIREEELIVPGLAPVFQGLRVIQLTDIHYQKGNDQSLMEKVVETVQRANADLILHTGDYLARDTHSLPELTPYFQEMSKGTESFAILGNHDRWHGSEKLFQQFFRETGIELLINQSRVVQKGGESLSIVGLDSAWGGFPDIEKAYKGVRQEQAAITLMHEPDYFDEIRKHRQSICQLSGHTHGGQCRVPLVKYAPVTVKYGKKYIDGHFSHGENQRVFVSAGLGTTGLRVRFGCPPEVVVHTLRTGSTLTSS